VFGVFAGIGVLGGVAGEPLVLPLVGALGTAIAFVILLTGVPNLVAGIRLLAHKPRARLLALLLAVINLTKFPWGTILAAYTFWVLLQDRTRELFRRA